jgi:hypothetical protein
VARVAVAGAELGEKFIPRAGEARVITGGARNTGCCANTLRFFTSGALTPRLGDGLMLTVQIGSRPGERILDAVLWNPSNEIPTFADGARFHQPASLNLA